MGGYGGTPIHITEMDPETGCIAGNPDDVEVNEHYAAQIANWRGDEWTRYPDGSLNEWFEGAAMIEHEGFYYLFVSYGGPAESIHDPYGALNQPYWPICR